MGMVTDVKWKCPGCGKDNIAQLSGDFYNVEDYPLSRTEIPCNADLRWNPPCDECGKYKLVEPPVVMVEFPVVACTKEEDGAW